jgi:two-component system, LuxR family, response regulator FixJ
LVVDRWWLVVDDERLTTNETSNDMHSLTNARQPTVFLLDDDPAARQSLAAMTRTLEMPLTVVASVNDFLDRFDPAQPGCLVVAVQSPGTNGLDLLENLHQAGVFFAAIAVSAKADVATAVRAMRAGAIDFLEKPLDDEKLWSALQEALECDAEHRRRQAQMERIRRRMEKLTTGETEVLGLLQAGKSNRAIAAALAVSVRTVEVRRAKLLEKMKAASLAEMLRDVILLEVLDEKQAR